MVGADAGTIVSTRKLVLTEDGSGVSWSAQKRNPPPKYPRRPRRFLSGRGEAGRAAENLRTGQLRHPAIWASALSFVSSQEESAHRTISRSGRSFWSAAGGWL